MGASAIDCFVASCLCAMQYHSFCQSIALADHGTRRLGNGEMELDDAVTFQPPAGYYIEDLSIGMTDRFAKTVTEADIVLFSGVSGDTNPVHLDEEYAAMTRFKGRITHGMLNASFISAVLGTRLPGPGSIYVSQNLKFRAPVRPGDTVTAICTVSAIDRDRQRVTMDTVCVVRDHKVITGDAVLLVPSRETLAV